MYSLYKFSCFLETTWPWRRLTFTQIKHISLVWPISYPLPFPILRSFRPLFFFFLLSFFFLFYFHFFPFYFILSLSLDFLSINFTSFHDDKNVYAVSLRSDNKSSLYRVFEERKTYSAVGGGGGVGMGRGKRNSCSTRDWLYDVSLPLSHNILGPLCITPSTIKPYVRWFIINAN